jgi:DNA-binding MarR family transcriptional regulator
VAVTVDGAESTVRLLSVIGRLGRMLRPMRSAGDLTPTQISVLATISREGPTPMALLAERESLNPTMLSRVIGKLADAGLIRRSTAPGDRRSALVAVTARGRALRERIHRERSATLASALAALSPAERDAIEDALPALEALAEQLR